MAVPAEFRDYVPDGSTLLVALPRVPADVDPVGVVAVSGEVPDLRVERVWVRPDLRRQGLGRTILELACAHARAQGAAVLTVRLGRRDQGTAALVRGAKVLGEHLSKKAEPDRVLPAGFGWRVMTADEYAGWYEALVRSYAEENLARSGGDLARALAWSRADLEQFLPGGLATPATSVLALTADAERVGHLWLNHDRWRGTTFVLDLEILPERRGEGWARAAIALAERLTLEAGNYSLGLHVSGDNVGARRLYLSEGLVVSVTTYDLLTRNAP